MDIAHIVSHTHWDREWRYPLWQTRLMLKRFMTELFQAFDQGAYPGFLLDGQVAPVLDFLEVQPHERERIKEYVAQGKLEIGPWLTLPDEYPLAGESLVRNLLWGHRRAAEFGGVFKVGYTPFGWGQTAQLPQIYAGFDIDVAMVGKRVSKDRAPQSEFLWQAPDGSTLLTTRFGELGRQNFYLSTHLSALFNVDHLSDDWRYQWQAPGVLFHRTDTEYMEQDFFRIDLGPHWFAEWIDEQAIERVWATTDESVLDHDRLMMNGCDYTFPQMLMPQMIARLNEVDAGKDRKWVHTTMTAFVDLMREQIDRDQLVTVQGELRDGPAGPCTANALSTRLYVKQKNRQAENRLIQFAEVFHSIVGLLGGPQHHDLLDQAWRFLLNAHPHDSINGVTQDKTVRDVESRLDQVLDIAQAVGDDALQHLVKQIDCSRFAPEDAVLIAFNPLPYPRRDVVDAWVCMPRPEGFKFWPFFEEGLMVFDTEGAPCPTQWQGQTDAFYPVAADHSRAWPFPCSRHRIMFDTGELPAGGYRVFRVGSINELKDRSATHQSSITRTATLRRGPNALENDFLKVVLNSDGSFNLTAKHLGLNFNNLNFYEDTGEMGDYWVTEPCLHNETHTTQGCSARIWTRQDGPVQATLVSEIAWSIPRRLDAATQCRDQAAQTLTIQTAITLQAHSDQVQVEVTLDNQCQDHRLRVMFPTGLTAAQCAHTGGHFHVDSRPIQPQGPCSEAAWRNMGTQPCQRFVDLSDGQQGITFLHDGLTEYEVLDEPDRTVALTLLRSVKNWICTEGRVGSSYPSQKGSQCLGRHTYRYALRPHRGDWQMGQASLHADCFAHPVHAIQTNAHGGSLTASQMSFWSIDNPHVRVSAFKQAQDRDTWIIRCYNPTPDEQAANITLPQPARQAWLVNLNENRQMNLPTTATGAIAITLAPHKIVTVEFEMA